ncbi:MAG: hypothetical protein E6772_16980 [Dysgonomonas sp.]|nr:hypothetical protein [Dysgonomonas sp.]
MNEVVLMVTHQEYKKSNNLNNFLKTDLRYNITGQRRTTPDEMKNWILWT